MLAIIVGLSGSGKSTALRALADLGFYTIENYPIKLLPELVNLVNKEPQYRQSAVIFDSLEDLKDLKKDLKIDDAVVVYLDASNESVLRRYSETRRPHPRYNPDIDQSLIDTILREREIFQDIKEHADFLIDTSNFNSYDLRVKVKELFSSQATQKTLKLRVNFLTFGYKYGIPFSSDMILDVRFLRNPYYDVELKELTGRELKVREYVFADERAKEYISRTLDYLDFCIKNFVSDGRSYLNIGVGCSGGKHRSISVAIELAKLLENRGFLTSVQHRDN